MRPAEIQSKETVPSDNTGRSWRQQIVGSDNAD